MTNVFRIRSCSGPYFPPFGLSLEKYEASLRFQSKCEKIRTRITWNTDTFHAMLLFIFQSKFTKYEKLVSCTQSCALSLTKYLILIAKVIYIYVS